MYRHQNLNGHRLHCTQAGFTWLELLIALFIFSVGLLGLGGLQANGLLFTHDNGWQSQATVVALNMADRIRTNAPGVRSGAYDALGPVPPPAPECNPGIPRDPDDPGCTPEQMALYDMIQWAEEFRKLPEGTGTVTRINQSPPVYAVQVTWRERASSATTDCADAAAEETACFRLVVRP